LKQRSAQISIKRNFSQMSTDKYQVKPLRTYIKDLSAKLPAPGGGSASALTGCLGAALINMVLNFTVGKEKYRAYEGRLKQALRRNAGIQSRLLKLVDEDARAYRSGNAKESLKVPYEVCKLCLEALSSCPRLIKITNRNLITDIADAAVLLEAALSGAYYNVLINLKYLPDTRGNKKILNELNAMKREAGKLRDRTEEQIGKLIRR